MDDMTEMMGALKYARMNNGLKMSDLVTPIEYEGLEAYFKENKSPVPLAMMARFKPYFISAVVSEGLMKCEKKSSIEQMIMTEAKRRQVCFRLGEPLNFRPRCLIVFLMKNRQRTLLCISIVLITIKNTTLELFDLYKKQDIESMDSVIVKSDPGMAQFMDLLLYNRNFRWADQIMGEVFDTRRYLPLARVTLVEKKE